MSWPLDTSAAGSASAWFVNSEARKWTCSSDMSSVRAFHSNLKGYTPTPLTEVCSLAEELDVSRLFVKDESARFDLGAFKILGASWAVFCSISARCGYTGEPSLEQLAEWIDPRERLTLVTASDGNHGRAVARLAMQLGLSAEIYVPAVVPDAVVELIRAESAVVVLVDGPYDQAVMRARAHVESESYTLLIQDTSWLGYEDIPQLVVDGYSTLFGEIDEQLSTLGIDHLELVTVPAGVGSLAQAAVAHYRSGLLSPGLMTVEPDTASGLLASLALGRLHSVETGYTVMNGLNCGSPSPLAWPCLANGLDAAIAIDDKSALVAMEDLRFVGLDAGPSGAAAFAGTRRALTGYGSARRRNELGVDADSNIVLISTEGASAKRLSGCSPTGDAEFGA